MLMRRELWNRVNDAINVIFYEVLQRSCIQEIESEEIEIELQPYARVITYSHIYFSHLLNHKKEHVILFCNVLAFES